MVERGAGTGSAFADAEYVAAGAESRACDEVWEGSELVLKVKEPLAGSFRASAPGSCCSPTCTSRPRPS